MNTDTIKKEALTKSGNVRASFFIYRFWNTTQSALCQKKTQGKISVVVFAEEKTYFDGHGAQNRPVDPGTVSARDSKASARFSFAWKRQVVRYDRRFRIRTFFEACV